MPIQVKTPDGGIANFADGTPRETIVGALRKKFPAPQAVAPGKENRSDYQAPSMLQSAATGLGDAVTFGTSDEIAGAVNYAKNLGAEGSYTEGRDAARARHMDAQETNPGSFLAGQVAGGVATSIVPGGAAVKGASLLGKVGRAALVGAGEGAAYGAGSADGDLQDRAQGALQGGMTGAVAGGAGPLVGRAVGGVVSKLPKIPNINELRAVKNGLYDASEKAGVVLKPQTTSSLFGRLQNRLAVESADPVNHAGTISALNTFEKGLQTPNISLKKVDQLRGRLGEIAAADPKSSDAMMARQVRKEIDKAIDDTLSDPSKIDVAPGGNVADAVKTLKQARVANIRYRNAEMIDETMMKAQNSALWANGDPENAIRTAFRGIANKPKQMARLSDSEREMVLGIARGQGKSGGSEYIARLIGKLAPTGVVSGGIGSAIGAGIGGAIGGPVGATVGAAALPAAGAVVKRVIGSKAQRKAADIAASIATGGQAARNTQPAERALTNAFLGVSPALQANLPRIPMELWLTNPRGNVLAGQ